MFQIGRTGNSSDPGVSEAFVAKSIGRLKIKLYVTLLGARLVVEETELLFEACIDGKTLGHSDGDSMVLIWKQRAILAV